MKYISYNIYPPNLHVKTLHRVHLLIYLVIFMTMLFKLIEIRQKDLDPHIWA